LVYFGLTGYTAPWKFDWSILENIALPTESFVAEAPITATDLGSKMYFNDFIFMLMFFIYVIRHG